MTIMVSGGIGKNVAFSALIPLLYEKYGEFNIMSGYPDLYDGLEGVRRSVDFNIEYGYEDYFKGQDRFAPEPYNNNSFYRKRIHLIEAFASELGLKYNPNKHFPLISNKIPYNLLNDINDIASRGPFVVVQFMGGNQATNNQMNPKFMVKDYPLDLVSEFVDKFRVKYPGVNLVNFNLPFEIEIQNVFNAGNMPYIAVPYLLSKAVTFVAIDSCLQHFSACSNVRKKGIVLWGATSPKSFGYEHNINLVGKCSFKDLHCTRPYFQHTSDIVGKGNSWLCKTGECMNISVDEIFKELDKIILPEHISAEEKECEKCNIAQET